MPMLGRREQETTMQSYTPPERVGQGRMLGRREQQESGGWGQQPPRTPPQRSSREGSRYSGNESVRSSRPASDAAGARRSGPASDASGARRSRPASDAAGSRLSSRAASEAGAPSAPKTPEKRSSKVAGESSAKPDKKSPKAQVRGSPFALQTMEKDYNPFQTLSQLQYGHPSSREPPKDAPVSSRRSTASSEYSFSHLEGYSGHLPDDNRNLRKYGKLFKQGNTPRSASQPQFSITCHNDGSLNPPSDADRFHTEYSAGFRGLVGTPSVPSSRRSSRSSVASSALSFEHLEGYSGHQPDSSRNAGKYGKTFKDPNANLSASNAIGQFHRVAPGTTF